MFIYTLYFTNIFSNNNLIIIKNKSTKIYLLIIIMMLTKIYFEEMLIIHMILIIKLEIKNKIIIAGWKEVTQIIIMLDWFFF